MSASNPRRRAQRRTTPRATPPSLRRRCVAVLQVAGAVVLAACGESGPTDVEGLPAIHGATALATVGTDFRFEPSTIDLEAGQPVNLTLEVTDGGHNLVIPDIGFVLPIIDEGERTSGGLVIDEPGSYEFVCTVPGHIAEGMVGTITVE